MAQVLQSVGVEPDAAIGFRNEMASCCRGVVVFLSVSSLLTMLVYKLFHEYPPHHPTTNHTGCYILIGGGGLATIFFMQALRLALEWLEYREKYRLSICERIHES